jgi:hypothetical protein
VESLFKFVTPFQANEAQTKQNEENQHSNLLFVREQLK